MTPYIRFHPGGVKHIMMGAGCDATALFNNYHAWVNIDFMLAKCLVGLAEAPSERSAGMGTPTAVAAVQSAGGRASASMKATSAPQGAPSSEAESMPAGEAAAGRSSCATIKAEPRSVKAQTGAASNALPSSTQKPALPNHVTSAQDAKTERPAGISTNSESVVDDDVSGTGRPPTSYQ